VNTLVLALLEIAVRIGRWLVKRLARWARAHLVGYMRGRIEDFKRRLKRADDNDWERREAWLKGRISRWTAAMKWIEKRSATEAKKLAHTVCALPEFGELPEQAACERFIP
jgi:hypothetical protein